MRPVKVIVGILLVVALGEALVERAAPCKKKNNSGIVLVLGIGETTIAVQKIPDECWEYSFANVIGCIYKNVTVAQVFHSNVTNYI